jgi:ferredoxin
MDEHGYPALRLHDLAGTEGQFGILLTFTMDVIPLPRLRPAFFTFDNEVEALRFVHWVGDTARTRGYPPTNLKVLSESHVAAVRTVRHSVETAGQPAVYVDFDDAEEFERFEAALDAGKWKAESDDVEARAWHADRFRPQQTKRLGPGYIAAEILMPTKHLERFFERATQLAGNVGVHLESEVYVFDEGQSLVIAGYMTQGPRRGFVFEMALAPMLVDLAMARYDGFPYVLGRWQSPFFKSKYGSGGARQLRRMKKRADRRRLLNPGVFFAPAFRLPGVAGVYQVGFPVGLRVLRGLYGTPGFSHLFRRLIGNAPRRALPARSSATRTNKAAAAVEPAALAEHTRGCVNCGECNSVCPIFHDAGIRLPQMLTHLGEGLQQRDELVGTPQLLLDLCMRCGNCEEVCQADIPHLSLYAQMEAQAGPVQGERRERHAAILTTLRHSERYLRDFLNVRPGYYLNRTPASLPGEVRFVLFRAENEDGADVSCLHCGACVPVCPTEANHEYEVGTDLRRITTEWSRCVGCGTCVEVCPANQINGGRTLRVMEAPTREFFEVVRQLESDGKQPVGGTS